MNRLAPATVGSGKEDTVIYRCRTHERVEREEMRINENKSLCLSSACLPKQERGHLYLVAGKKTKNHNRTCIGQENFHLFTFAEYWVCEARVVVRYGDEIWGRNWSGATTGPVLVTIVSCYFRHWFSAPMDPPGPIMVLTKVPLDVLHFSGREPDSVR